MPLDYLTHLGREAARFGAVLRDTDPAARVPTCPDWDAADLAWHLGEVFFFWGTVVRERLEDPDAVARNERPGTFAGLLEYYDEQSAMVQSALAASPPGSTHWTWSTDHTTDFVRRRMAQEAMVHRLDAELAAGQVTDLDAELAADGVSEAFEHFFGGTPAWATSVAVDGPVGLLRAEDLGREWHVQLGRLSGTSPSGPVYDDEPTANLVAAGKPSYTVTGTARDLEAWVWCRPVLRELVVDGEQDDYGRLAAILGQGID